MNESYEVFAERISEEMVNGRIDTEGIVRLLYAEKEENERLRAEVKDVRLLLDAVRKERDVTMDVAREERARAEKAEAERDEARREYCYLRAADLSNQGLVCSPWELAESSWGTEEANRLFPVEEGT